MFWDFYYNNDISQFDIVDTIVLLQSIKYLVFFDLFHYLYNCELWLSLVTRITEFGRHIA